MTASGDDSLLRRFVLPQFQLDLGNMGCQVRNQLLKLISVFDKKEKNKGGWEKENSALLESQTGINKDVISDGTCCDGNDAVDIHVNGNECRCHENDVVTKEGARIQQLQRVEPQNSGSNGSKMEGKKVIEHREYDDKVNVEGKKQVNPLRPYGVNCPFYIKTGTCKFGQNCIGNHPLSSVFQPVGDKEKGLTETNGSVSDARKIGCTYFQTPGGSKYGDACRDNHSPCRVKGEYPKLNFIGLPLRPLAQECTYYMQNGCCGYGANCKFHHPNPSAKKELESGDSLVNRKSVTDGVNLPKHYAHVPNGLGSAPETSYCPQTMPQTAGCNQSQVSTSIPANKYPIPHQHMSSVSKRVDLSAPSENPGHIKRFPERPIQPDCHDFMNTGNCNYGPACKYKHRAIMLPAQTSQLLDSNSNIMRINETSLVHHHHVKTGQRNRVPTSSALSQKGLPLKPGVKLCWNYAQQGKCRFGRNCTFYHSDDHSPDVPVAAKLEPLVPNNVNSAWGDGWEM